MSPRAPAIAALLLAPLLAGCAGHLAERIAAPERNEAAVAASGSAIHQLGLRFELAPRDDGPDIAFLVLEPGDYRLRTRVFHFADSRWSYSFRFRAPASRAPARRGTVVLTHGWGMDASMMLPWAAAFAEAGFRAVVVELRNHGRSGEGPAGFGTREAGDVLAVVRRLEAQHRLARPLHLFGISWGAVTMLHAAERLGEDVGAVVAMEPFANAADAIRGMRGFLRSTPADDARGWLLRFAALAVARDGLLEDAIDRASAELDLDLRALDTAEALDGLAACPLFIHGRVDTVLPYLPTRELAAAHPDAQLLELVRDGHFSTAGRIDLLGAPLARWLASVRPGAPCPAIDAPPPAMMGFDGFEGEPPREGAPRRVEDAGAVRVDPRDPPPAEGDSG